MIVDIDNELFDMDKIGSIKKWTLIDEKIVMKTRI